MTQDQGLAGLLVRIEAATGPDRGLDTAVERALFGDVPIREGWQGTLDYTASLDAALALCTRVLPGWLWEVGARPQGYRAGLWRSLVHMGSHHAIGPTPALALIAALLKALISQSSESGEGDRASRAEGEG